MSVHSPLTKPVVPPGGITPAVESPAQENLTSESSGKSACQAGQIHRIWCWSRHKLPHDMLNPVSCSAHVITLHYLQPQVG